MNNCVSLERAAMAFRAAREFASARVPSLYLSEKLDCLLRTSQNPALIFARLCMARNLRNHPHTQRATHFFVCSFFASKKQLSALSLTAPIEIPIFICSLRKALPVLVSRIM